MTDEKPVVTDEESIAPEPETVFDAEPAVDAEPQTPPQYGVWPFSIREIVLMGIWAVAFTFSFFSLSYFQPLSVWGFGLSWILTIGLPTVAVFLLVLRRLSPQGIRRVGSLGIDQFASVAFSVSAMVWLQEIIESMFFFPGLGTWVHWSELVLMLAGVVFTVVAPYIPGLREDFVHRAEVVAHPVARPLRPIAVRPAPAPVAPDAAHTAAVYPVADAAPVAEPTPLTGETTVLEEVVEVAAVEPEPRAAQAFWALVPEPRDVLDETGAPLFRIDATAWALVIEDRGEVFVVRHEDGRIGYLHDVSGVTRG